MTTMGRRPNSNALRSTKRVCGSGPSAASTSSSAPSAMRRTRSTSPPKSAWPGVSMMLTLVPASVRAMFLARIVMPRCRSNSLESEMRPCWPPASRSSSSRRHRPHCPTVSPRGVGLPCQALAAALQRLGVRFGTVLTSPLVRARQTTEGVLEHWNGPRPKLVECEHLAPGFRPKRLARDLNELQADGVALVGHQPDMSAWAAWLIGSNKAQLDFAKAGTAHIACGDGIHKGAGALVWLVTTDW